MKIKNYKTWSLVSNSSLSETFALFQKHKFQKLCFLPPNIVLGLKKGSPKIKVKKNLGLK